VSLATSAYPISCTSKSQTTRFSDNYIDLELAEDRTIFVTNKCSITSEMIG